MKILLIHPPRNREALTFSNFEPLALEILARALSRHTVRMIDLRFERGKALDAELSSFRPDIAGISINNTIDVSASKEILRRIKMISPAVTTIAGGHHVTMRPQDFYTPYIDALFLGWAEKTLPAYVACLSAGKRVDGIDHVIVLRDGIPANRDPVSPAVITAGDIPLPDRDIARTYRKYYRNELGRKTASVNTARGCPYRCRFCACWKAAGGRYVVRSAEDVYAELCEISDDIEYVFFADDNTFYDIERAQKLCRLIKESGIRKKYSGYCRSDSIIHNPNLFRKWKEIGLDNLTIGFEAVREKSLTRFKKANSVANNIRAIKLLYDLDITFCPYFLVDPEFDADDFKAIASFINVYNLVTPRFTVLTPLPGTDLYQEKKSLITRGYDFFDFAHCVYPPKLTPKGFFREFTRLYYGTYSVLRWVRAVLRKVSDPFRSRHCKKWELSHMPLAKILLLRLAAVPLHVRLFHQSVR